LGHFRGKLVWGIAEEQKVRGLDHVALRQRGESGFAGDIDANRRKFFAENGGFTENIGDFLRNLRQFNAIIPRNRTNPPIPPKNKKPGRERPGNALKDYQGGRC
jgi:hypothetical protein